MDASLRLRIRERAGSRCEYYRISLHQAPVVQFHVEHIRARQHGGTDVLENLCLACQQCNCFKDPNLSAHDPETDTLVPLFNPRTQTWSDHFTVQHGIVLGITAIGRATIELLRMNTEDRVDLRVSFGDPEFNA